jgi:hypothetical protein
MVGYFPEKARIKTKDRFSQANGEEAFPLREAKFSQSDFRRFRAVG